MRLFGAANASLRACYSTRPAHARLRRRGWLRDCPTLHASAGSASGKRGTETAARGQSAPSPAGPSDGWPRLRSAASTRRKRLDSAGETRCLPLHRTTLRDGCFPGCEMKCTGVQLLSLDGKRWAAGRSLQGPECRAEDRSREGAAHARHRSDRCPGGGARTSGSRAT